MILFKTSNNTLGLLMQEGGILSALEQMVQMLGCFF